MFTEEEAKTKWCPFARSERDGLAVNREAGDFDTQGNETVTLTGRFRCIASKCMAWRGTSYTTPIRSHDGIRYERREKGYCGLAGKVET